jgi:mannosyltransferase
LSTTGYPDSQVGARPAMAARLRSIGLEGWVLVALIVLAAVIRVITLDNQSIWADEALTVYEAGLPFGSMIHTVITVETTPPLYFVVVWVWARLFGTDPVVLRTVSSLAGLTMVPIAYLCAKELVSRRAGLLAAAFVAVNPFMIWYSQEARSYMLVAALSGAAFLWFIRSLRAPTRRNLIWWAVFSSLAVMTHFFASFAIVPEAVWLLWRHRARLTRAAVGVVAFVQLLMLPLAVNDASAAHGVAWISASPPQNRIAATFVEWGASNLDRRTTTPEGLAIGLILIVALVLLIGRRGDERMRWGARVAAVVTAVVFLAPLALGAIGIDYFLSRNEIPAFIPVTVIVAAACTAPRARWAGGLLAAALLVVFALTAINVQTHTYLERPDWRGLADKIGPATTPRAVLAADGTTADALKIYLPGVHWTQLPDKRELVSQIEVVGVTKKIQLAVAQEATGASGVLRAAGHHHRHHPPKAQPRKVAPPGTVLLDRYRFKNWIVARFALEHPMYISTDGLARIAGRFFTHVPAALLIFFQHPNQG